MLDKSREIEESELILNPDGSIYHLKLRPEHIADTIILVGDQHRVARISQHFDRIEHAISNREFITHTGYIGNKRLTALSTGIGTDNIDIVLNELDAIVNIDLETRTVKKELRQLKLIRLGTSGALREDLPVDSFLASTYGLGLDGLLNHYKHSGTPEENDMQQRFMQHCDYNTALAHPYFVKASNSLLQLVGEGMHQGITATASGFYGPQGRELRLETASEDLNNKLSTFSFGEHRISNYEMETAALYGLGRLLGHSYCTVCAVIANRLRREYSKDYQQCVDALIASVLERLTT